MEEDPLSCVASCSGALRDIVIDYKVTIAGGGDSGLAADNNKDWGEFQMVPDPDNGAAGLWYCTMTGSTVNGTCLNLDDCGDAQETANFIEAVNAYVHDGGSIVDVEARKAELLAVCP